MGVKETGRVGVMSSSYYLISSKPTPKSDLSDFEVISCPVQFTHLLFKDGFTHLFSVQLSTRVNKLHITTV